MSIGSIPASSISQWSSALFSKLDNQNKGYLEKSDLESAFATSGSGATDTSGADQLFQALDSNGDGKVTSAELTQGVQSLADTLFSNLRQAGLQGAAATDGPKHHHHHQGGDNQDSGDDAGFTKDQLTAMSTNGSTNSRRASLMSRLAANFDTADTNGDGKISRSEAMAFDKSSRTTASSAAGTTQASATDPSASVAALVKLMELVRAYEAGAASKSTSTATGTTLSVTA